MATYTDNYHLSKPETTDSQQSFMEDYATNMDIIDENMGGGSGGGGHVIIDENGIEVAQEPNMQFTGKVEVTDDSINEKTVVEVLPEVVEVTLAEYIALGNVVNTDGKLYCITDLNNSEVQGYPPLIYSTDEREVGVWRDGKPLYQKTYQLTSPSSTGSAIVIQNIEDLNVDTPVNIFGNILNVPINFFFDYSQNNYGNYVACFVTSAKTGIAMKIGADVYANQPFNVTLQYTKTTDTAGSGTWNGQGGLAHHYSTSEKVIGTWIDGKPLYEKTLDCGYGVPSGGSLIQPIGVSDIAEIINWNVWSTNGAFSRLFPYVNDTGSVRVDVDINNGNIRLYPMGISLADQKVYAVLQYTKTTD